MVPAENRHVRRYEATPIEVARSEQLNLKSTEPHGKETTLANRCSIYTTKLYHWLSDALRLHEGAVAI